jgi:hypothetical protein
VAKACSKIKTCGNAPSLALNSDTISVAFWAILAMLDTCGQGQNQFCPKDPFGQIKVGFYGLFPKQTIPSIRFIWIFSRQNLGYWNRPKNSRQNPDSWNWPIKFLAKIQIHDIVKKIRAKILDSWNWPKSFRVKIQIHEIDQKIFSPKSRFMKLTKKFSRLNLDSWNWPKNFLAKIQIHDIVKKIRAKILDSWFWPIKFSRQNPD